MAEKNKNAGNIIIMSIASARNPSWAFWQSSRNIQPPINTTMATDIVRGKPVDVARNELVEHAQSIGARYMLLLDDDVIAPPEGLIKLFHQIVYSKGKVKVASGVYYTKMQPPVPVILDKNRPGGVVDWVQGEIIECDYAGCGFMLIDMTIFDEIEKPYFYFNRGRVDLIPDVGFLGEDVWFCEKVLKAGYRIVVDTAVQCGHEDQNSGLVYRHDARFGMGVWGDPKDGQVYYRPTLEQAKAARAEAKYIEGKVAWGYNPVPDGFTNAPKECGDVAGIMSQLHNVTEAKIMSLLQYRTNAQIAGILKALSNVMVDGAPVEITVPDAVTNRDRLTDESSVEDIELACGSAVGAYQGLYTVRFMDEAMKLAGFKDTCIVKENGNLIVKGRK